MEDCEVGEEKEDGFYLMGPLWVKRGVAQDDPQLFQSSIFLFFKKITVFIMTMVTPRCTGGPDSVCFSNLFVNKCTMLHMRWTHVLKWKECVSFVLTFIEQLLFWIGQCPEPNGRCQGGSQHHFPTIGYFTSMNMIFNGVLFDQKYGFIKTETM